ncbi:MAG: hypothetical protein IPG39_18060 [Bacteroidetes bacterium]|nr:hypothetical protein [Bacteroidota bacterium]
MGEAVVTNAEGRYSISFTNKDFTGSETEKGPDVLIRVYKDQKLLTESDVKYNSKKKIEINLKVNYINNDKNINKNTFTVSGKVTNLALEPLPKQEVILVDIDLLSAAVYKTITKVSDFKKTKIEVLGKTNTNANGAYIISFERKILPARSVAFLMWWLLWYMKML